MSRRADRQKSLKVIDGGILRSILSHGTRDGSISVSPSLWSRLKYLKYLNNYIIDGLP